MSKTCTYTGEALDVTPACYSTHPPAVVLNTLQALMADQPQGVVLTP
jgi:hypothetical protein